MNISKTRYCKGLQCPKILWMDKHMPERFDDSVMDKGRLEAGIYAGGIARGYFGEYTEVPYSADKSLMIAETQRLLDAGIKTICEASFSVNGTFCSVDILRVFKTGVEIIEVKGSSSLKDIYLDDMAFQCHVLASAGLNVQKVSLLHINKTYTRRGSLDLKNLFTLVDCTEKTAPIQKDMAANIERIRNIAEASAEPDIEIGRQCGDPYKCGYAAYCWRHIPGNSVFDLAGRYMNFGKRFSLYKKGVVTMQQLLASDEKINKKTRLQAECMLNNLPPAINKKAISGFLETLRYPLYFLDFETCMYAVPEYEGTRPYMQLPFQYSLHIQEKPGVMPEHREFLAAEGTDPRRELAGRLCDDIPAGACVLAYNMFFEKGRILELAAAFPEYAEHLMAVHDNIRDLMVPFKKMDFYCKEMRNCYSLKAVLPALFPNESELDYNALNLVHNGGEASNIFLDLPKRPAEEKEHIRKALLAYCRLDTLAMVKIVDVLNAAVA